LGLLLNGRVIILLHKIRPYPSPPHFKKMGRVSNGQVRQIYNSPYGRSTDGIPLAMVGDDDNASNSSCFSDCNSRCDINRSETSS
jgi:hypothetical protein